MAQQQIVHVVESILPEAGSVTHSLRGLVSALKTQGILSTIVARDGQWPDSSPPVKPKNCTSAMMIQIHGWGYDEGLQWARSCQRSGAPYLVSPAGAFGIEARRRRSWGQRLHSWLRDRRAMRRAAAWVAQNDFEQSELEQLRMHNKIHRLPYGWTFEEPATGESNCQAHGSRGDRTMLLLDAVEPQSGCVALLKALAEMGTDAHGWIVVLAGPDKGHWRKMLEAAVRRKGGEHRVRFEEASDLRTQRALLDSADLLVAPSLDVRSPVSLLQAIDAGVAAMASTTTVPAELNGCLPVCNPTRESICQTLQSVLRMSDGDRKLLAERVHERARSTLDWSVLVHRYLELYQSIN